ncbi:hypothetical protein IJ384_06655 [bacterium]|nr:hypothetical protein [bacterium]
MLVAFWQVQRLTREINDLEKRAMDVRTRLSNHQKYAGILGGSSILTLGNISGLSAELLPRASLFAKYSDQASSMSAMQNLQYMKMMGLTPFMGNPMMQGQYEMSAFMNFKKEALKALKQQEAATLNEVEKEIELELNSIEQRIKMKRAELESCKQLAAKEAEDMVPSFGLR